MSDRPGQRELVFCHSCRNEWYRDTHGLICPDCESDMVEIIEPDRDPRDDFILDDPQHAYDNVHDAPDPDEDDIDAFHPRGEPGNPFLTQRSWNSSSAAGELPSFRVFTGLVDSMLSGAMQGQALQAARQGQQRSPGSAQEPHSGSPLQEGPSMSGGSGIHYSTSVSFMRSGDGVQTVSMRNYGNYGSRGEMEADLGGILNNILGGIGGGAAPVSQGAARAPGNLLQALFQPMNAAFGDVVWSNEQMDRILSQLMEQHAGSSAPGPASEAAINSLNKIKITKEQLDESGKAECSICMDAVDMGGEVTELPCKHWFHGECVSAWLREHDTCPQCRRGIMPRDGDGTSPRSTGEAPLNWQIPSDLQNPGSTDASRQNSAAQAGGADAQGSRPGTGNQNPQSPQEGGATGISGWMGRHFGRSNAGGGGGGGDG